MHKGYLHAVATALVLTGSLAITACAVAAKHDSDTLSGEWRLLQFRSDGEMVDVHSGDREPVLQFEAGRLAGMVGCNRLVGGYSTDGSKLRIDPDMATTMMACPPPLMEQDRAVSEAIGQAASYRIDGDRLTILNASGETVLGLARRQHLPLIGTEWRLDAYNNGNQAVVSVAAEPVFVLQLREDGELGGKACNTYGAAFEQSGGAEPDGQLPVTGPIRATRMACPQDGVMAREAAYFAALERVAAYRISGDKLTLLDPDGKTLAQFTGTPGGRAAD